MSNNFSFSVMPSVSISRSRFERKSQHKTSFNLGDIVPIYVDEVLPGDTRSFDMAALVRMSTPIAPIMDNIYLDYFAFFVPSRLTWHHWKEFMGENSESAGIPSREYLMPTIRSQDATIEGSLIDRMIGNVVINDNDVSALPFRAYYLIYNRWFRNQNLEAPLPVYLGDSIGSENVLIGSSDKVACNDIICKASKLPDYFVSALPYAQKGEAVKIPLGTTAPIVGDTTTHNLLNGLQFNYISTGSSSQGLHSFSIDPTGYVNESDAGPGGNNLGRVSRTNLIADLSNATAVTINQLRYAFQLQKFLEKDALYGSRYFEILAAHFNVKSPDATLQEPEYLGGKRMNINIDQVLSTAGYEASSDTSVGAPGANSVSGFKGSLFTKSFTEHGYLFIMAVARQDHTYGQGINRMWTRKTRYDFYFPVFANLGAQTILNKEIAALDINSQDEVFGYQEAWAEYRYKPSMVSGLLNPSRDNSLSYWTLADKFKTTPTLSSSFILENRDNIERALVSGSMGPDFIADFYFKDIAVRPMPVYSIPGLVDHH